MAQDERFDVTFTLSIKGDKGFFAETKQTYGDMTYAKMTEVENTAVRVLLDALPPVIDNAELLKQEKP